MPPSTSSNTNKSCMGAIIGSIASGCSHFLGCLFSSCVERSQENDADTPKATYAPAQSHGRQFPDNLLAAPQARQSLSTATSEQPAPPR